MTSNRLLRRAFTWMVAAGLAALWWWPVNDFIDRPAYRVDVAYIAVVLVAGAMHVAALIQYQEMTRTANRGSDPVTRLYAYTQRIRYIFRACESAFALGIGVIGLIGYEHPALQRNPNYGKYVLTYFFGTILVTAYLTYRDWRVIRVIKVEQGA